MITIVVIIYIIYIIKYIYVYLVMKSFNIIPILQKMG